MKKKNESATAAAAAAAATTTTTESRDLKALIVDHSEFFDKLVSLIPSKFYLPNVDADSKPWFKGLSKSAKASLKQQTRENIKLARRNRHDPDKASQSSTLDLLRKSLVKPEQTDTVVVGVDNENGESESLTYEELRLRLRKKIDLLRGNRGAGEKSGIQKKRKRGNANGSDDGGGQEEEEGGGGRSVAAQNDLEFGKVRIGDEDNVGKAKKKRRMPKAKELERAQRLEEMKRENPAVAKKESWKAATSRAYGAKVHDDPKLLKESIKKQKRKTVKSAEKWKERVDRTNKMKSERQQKRTGNIAERAKDKKARKIAKREKKLMRPGFEGRKEGYITKT